MAHGGEWEQLTLRPLEAVPGAGDFTHSAIPNSAFKTDVDSYRFAALRFSDCVRTDQ
jgi:hypothetical protein